MLIQVKNITRELHLCGHLMISCLIEYYLNGVPLGCLGAQYIRISLGFFIYNIVKSSIILIIIGNLY